MNSGKFHQIHRFFINVLNEVEIKEDSAKMFIKIKGIYERYTVNTLFYSKRIKALP